MPDQEHGAGPETRSASPDVDLIQTLYALFNARRFEEAAALFAPEAILEQLPAPRQETGPAGYLAFVSVWTTAFPDASVTVNHIKSRGEGRYEVDLSTDGTHLGPLDMASSVRFKASGTHAVLHLRQLFEIRDGRITYSTVSFDFQDLVTQLVTVDVRKLLNHLERLRALSDTLTAMSSETVVDRNSLVQRIGTELDAARRVVRPYFER